MEAWIPISARQTFRLHQQGVCKKGLDRSRGCRILRQNHQRLLGAILLSHGDQKKIRKIKMVEDSSFLDSCSGDEDEESESEDSSSGSSSSGDPSDSDSN